MVEVEEVREEGRMGGGAGTGEDGRSWRCGKGIDRMGGGAGRSVGDGGGAARGRRGRRHGKGVAEGGGGGAGRERRGAEVEVREGGSGGGGGTGRERRRWRRGKGPGWVEEWEEGRMGGGTRTRGWTEVDMWDGKGVVGMRRSWTPPPTSCALRGCPTLGAGRPEEGRIRMPHTCSRYTGTDADYADVPEAMRPRPAYPTKPRGKQIGRLWCEGGGGDGEEG